MISKVFSALLFLLIIFSSLVLNAQRAQLYGTYLQHTHSLEKGSVDADLALLPDSFHFQISFRQDSKPIVARSGVYHVIGDTVNLLTSDGLLFARLVAGPGKEYLRMIWPTDNHLPVNVEKKNNFYRLSTFDQHGHRRVYMKLESIGNDNGAPSDYTIQIYDSLGQLVSIVPYKGGRKEGVEIHKFYIVEPDANPETSEVKIITRKLGKWREGKKVGVWKNYNERGEFIGKEKF